MSEQTAPASDIDERLQKYLAEEFSDESVVLGLSQHFRREGYVKIPNIVPEDLKAAVSAEVYRVLEHAKRVDTKLKATANTPRRMSTVGARHISEHSPLVVELYHSAALMAFLSRLARDTVVACPYEPERYVMTRQDRVGDTHGWHWGDFSFALIWIIEAPSTEVGGMLQCVPHTDWTKSDARVNDYLVKYPIKTYAHQTGDVYLLRTDTTLHRTVPLTEDATRIILNTAWASARDLERTGTHETMDALFD